MMLLKLSWCKFKLEFYNFRMLNITTKNIRKRKKKLRTFHYENSTKHKRDNNAKRQRSQYILTLNVNRLKSPIERQRDWQNRLKIIIHLYAVFKRLFRSKEDYCSSILAEMMRV